MINFGVIGTNWITERFIDAAIKVEDFSLTAVYSRTEEKAKEFASKFNVENIFTNLEEMARSEEIEAVYIASPNSLHAQQAILMMEHGKHVICEKPLASNTAEAEEMIRVARKNNVLFMEAMKSTLQPNFLCIKEHLHKIGKVRRYFASYCQYSSRYDSYKQGNVLNAFNPVFSNGALMDIGIYCIYPLVVLFGEPKQVQGMGYMLESGVDGQGSIQLQYEEMDASIMYSKITDSYVPCEIQGENGSIIIDKIHTPERVEIRYRDGSVEDISQPQESNTMYYEAKEFVELIKNGKVESAINSYNYSLITAKIMEEARKQIGVVYPADQQK
ncbi:Gfo/Idh/MocA family oxidoreductase [Bacillus sp. 165]|uniref:Gfo/Idh/MocA family protein n=1 Tax=Bacillus sp. 165 TaxID=1529117 RepID=UPI001ADB359D|nr:Gfo/Idh/MocA family oxidoreductase [Bacillus sp. 165]MBO9131452.1 Gfo/Idh/MocA family oxidoreductase [Bacillus sp. 165]